MKIKPTIVISAGGTGGHIFPGIAVGLELIKLGYNIVWIGTEHGIENQIVPKHNIAMETIKFYGIRKKGILALIKLPFLLLKSMLIVKAIFKRYRVLAVVGFGGYVTFPVCLMAQLRKYPLIIHEQNSIAGLTNRLLAKFGAQVLVATNTKLLGNNIEVVGNPVRDELTTLTNPQIRYSRRMGGLNILIVGGSLGAKLLNNTIPQVINRLQNINQVIHQVGKVNIQIVKDKYNKDVKVTNFINDMAQAYSDADLIICRSGAITVSEVMAVGIAAIFIPYANAVDDHQKFNALPLVEIGAAKMILESDFETEKLTKIIANLTRDECMQMAIKAQSLATINSQKKITKLIIKNIK